MTPASFHATSSGAGHIKVSLSGSWMLRISGARFSNLKQELTKYAANPQTEWDLQNIEQLDSAGATILWQGWGQRIPANCTMRDEHADLLGMIAAMPSHALSQQGKPAAENGLWRLCLNFTHHIIDFVALTGDLAMETLRLIRHPKDLPWKEISANIYKGGVMALPVTALVGGMIGVAMSYLMALQLRKFGADIFIINILGLAIIRELGPILMSVLVAGRSGSAMTAQIGVMRVTEEIDALATMGVSRSLRLILPKVVGLTLVAPLLLFWTSFWALAGGMVVAYLQLGIGIEFFVEHLPKVVKPVNLILATIKGFTFGLLVALIACHFGLRVKPNTESLSTSTTASVVTSITTVILVDALFAIATRSIGI